MEANSDPCVIVPGLVLFKRFLSVDEQLETAKWAMLQKDGWFNERGELNCGATRGRIYRAWKSFVDHDSLIERTCATAVAKARTVDKSMPQHNLTHLLLLRYLPSGGEGQDAMIWHRDDDPNDGDNDHPVVSLSLGCSCVFGYKLPGEKAKSVTLESGDMLLFGGPQRLIMHCVHSVLSALLQKSLMT